MVKNILIIEDDEGIRQYVKELLIEHGYAVHAASDGTTGIKLIKKSPPDLIVLDLGLPDLSGESVCTEIRKNYPELPVIILTARDTVNDVVRGLSLGADDYVTKPFAGEVLLARIQARLRTHASQNAIVKVGNLELNNMTIEVKRNNNVIKLTPQEFKLLEYLMLNKGRILTRDMILNRIWPSSFEIETRVVDVYVGYLRKKIDKGYDKKLLHSVRGFGYVLKE